MSSKTWKTALILSLVIPIGLVVSFRAANVTRGPLAVSETTTLDQIRWQHESLDGYVHFNESVEANYSGDITMNQSILVAAFEWHEPSYDGWDVANLCLNLNASVDEGFVQSVRLSLNDDYEYGRMHLGWPEMIKTGGLSITNYTALAQEVFLNLQGVGQPRNVSFSSLWVDWAFYSPYNQTHQAEAHFEVTYYNGTVFKKVVQPFLLTLVPDSNTRDTAVKITPGIKYSGLYLGGENTADFYEVHLIQGQNVHVEVNQSGYPLWSPAFRMYVYDPAGNVIVSAEPQEAPPFIYENANFNANATGDWYIELRQTYSVGFYSIEVDIR